MSEIPADILKTAEDTLDTVLCNFPEAGDVRKDSILDIAAALMAERMRCAQIASMFSMKPDRSIHPDIPWDQMKDVVKMTAHTTAQQIALEIMAIRSPSNTETPT